MAEHCEQKSVFEKGQIERDESYFSAQRVCGKKWGIAKVRLYKFRGMDKKHSICI